MKASDTVMSREQVNAYFYGGSWDVEGLTIEQAEISFKAGIREVVKIAIACDILCGEKESLKKGCPACKKFWLKVKELGL